MSVFAIVLLVLLLLVCFLVWVEQKQLKNSIESLEQSVDAFVVTVIEQQVTLSELVEATTTQVEDVHKAFTDVSFDILEAMPQTRDAGKKLRTIHDTTAENVYTTVRTVNKGIKLLKTELNARANKRRERNQENEIPLSNTNNNQKDD